MKLFESLINSNMSEMEIYNEIIKKRSIRTEIKYTNDSEEPFAIFVGGIGKDDLVTVNNRMHTLKMRFDLESIYLDFIRKVRYLCVNEGKVFETAVLSAVKKVPFEYFSVEDEEGLANMEVAKKDIEFYKGNYNLARDSYAGHVSDVDDEKMEAVYNLSKFKGTKDLAKCVEINSIICNLLAFSGYESVLAQGYFVDHLGKRCAHTFPFYKKDGEGYTLMDGALKKIKSNCLPFDIDFSKGLKVEIPLTVKYSDGRIVDSSYVYEVKPQKMEFNLKDTAKR